MKPLTALLLVPMLAGSPAAAADPTPQIIAHRGSSADRPENTLAAARRAIEAGATVVEVDVRRTKDGHLVLLHDATLDRTTTGKGNVADATLDEVRKLDAGTWFDPKFAGERVPTLAEVLTVCRGKVDVMIDLKETGSAYFEAVAAAVKTHGDPKRTVVGVRSVEQAKLFRRLLPDARQIGLLPEADDLDAFVSVGVGTVRVWTKWLSDPSLVERVRWAGAKLHLNTLTGKPDEVWPLLKHRPDSLAADDPALLRKTLADAPPAPPPAEGGTPVVIDTDIGSDVDDAFALGLALASRELDVKAVTTVGSKPDERAWIACRFLTQCGRRTIPVAAGGVPGKSSEIGWQVQYRRHPALIFGRMRRPEKVTAVELMRSVIAANPDRIVVIALGPLTNVAKLIDTDPDAARRIKRLVVMGGSVRVGYSGKPPAEAEWNLAADAAAARKVFASGVPITLIPLDATAGVKLERESRAKLFAAHTPLTFQVQSLYELWDQETPTLFDPVAVAAAFTDQFCRFEDLRLEIDDSGVTRISTDTAARPARVATAIEREKFLAWYVDRLTATGKSVLPRPGKNVAAVVEAGGFPARVQVAEDYDTDIELRWWMAGKPETKDVPPGGRRACRAVLTQDFDDLQGDIRAAYRAVIFNPVPGPPVGPNTRLSFRYKLTGTDQLRVQLYSLTNGYHRNLTLTGLATGAWTSATVDMTKLRRPDGTGGPLAAGERIDDIQFYIDPRAELIVDDVLLHDAAAAGERRPFPRRVVFTGWFDTGKQGQEWPGDFEIVPDPPPGKWRHAKSVPDRDTGSHRLRVSLRGERRLDPETEVSFRYRLTGTDALRIELRNSKTGWVRSARVKNLRTDGWAETTVSFAATAGGKEPLMPIDEVRFLPDGKGELALDDLLIYTPGNTAR